MSPLPLTEMALFAGGGGMMRGLRRAGWHTVAAAEIDAQCTRVLAAQFPETARYGDVTQLSGHALLESHGPVTLLSYTFPCQDLSVAGKRAGLAGDRSGLFYEAVRIRRELGCPLSLAENVPGLLSSDSGHDFARCLSALVGGTIAVPSDGWDNSGVAVGDDGICAWTMLDLQHFGPPQRRVRVFLLTAHAVGDTRAVVCDPAEILSLATRLRGDTPQGREARERVADPLTVGANQTCGFPGDVVSGEEGSSVIPLQEVNRATSSRRIQVGIGIGNDSDPMYTLLASEQHGVAISFGWQNSPEQGDDCRREASASLRTTTTPAVLAFAQNQRDEVWVMGVSGSRAADAGAKQQTYVLPPVCGTLESRSTNGIPRRLTPLECTRLQGWEDDALDIDPPLSDSAKYRMCGNGVGAPVAEWLGWRIRQAMERAA